MQEIKIFASHNVSFYASHWNWILTKIVLNFSLLIIKFGQNISKLEIFKGKWTKKGGFYREIDFSFFALLFFEKKRKKSNFSFFKKTKNAAMYTSKYPPKIMFYHILNNILPSTFQPLLCKRLKSFISRYDFCL